MLPVNFECAIEITKAYEEEGRWIVEGYAATSDFDMQEDIITDEAIRASARDLLENSTVLHNHNPDEAIGKVLSSDARPGGLFLKILISKTRPDIWQQVREGVLNKFSVRGKILEARKEWVDRLKKYARLILKMRLVEVSLVAVPANPKARAIRWYVEKALEEFEKAGGTIGGAKGGPEMKDENVVEEELLEAKGDPGAGAPPPKGFPAPEALGKEWSAHLQKAGLADKGEDEIHAAWIEFCKAQGYPYPYPYPYPKPGATNVSRAIELVDQLLAGEKDEGRKKLLAQLRALLSGAGYPAARKEEPVPPEGEKGKGSEKDKEKEDRKPSPERLARLKKLLDELKGMIEEEEGNSPAGGEAAKAAPAPEGKLAEIVGTVSRIAKTLGLDKDEGKEAKPALAERIADLGKRLEALEKAPGVRTSIEGQEALAGERNHKSIWKGLV